jgi:hypothetical protein
LIEALAELRVRAGDLWMLVAVDLWAIYSVLRLAGATLLCGVVSTSRRVGVKK